jgi:hypothetical protein
MIYDGASTATDPWDDSNYRTIKILGGTNSTDSALITWI